MASEALHGLGDIVLDRYELVRQLGSGGWGRVYLANDRMLHRPVAIKQLLPRLAADPAAVSRFLREASVIASIRDPHVLTIYDIVEGAGQHYMVMEYADAGTLAQVLQLEGSLSPYEALSVGIEVCQGLRAVHSKGIVHRDVKPANVMFFSREDGLPIAKIGDFGIALQAQAERLTPSDNVVGTLIYLSPEQASGSSTITPGSDLYSLGAVLYEMMTGELEEPLFLNPLFSKTNSSDALQQLTMFPEVVRPMLIKALQRKPENRFQNADEMLQALQRARSRLTVSFSTQTFDQIAPPEPLEPQPVPQPRFPARLLTVVGVTLTLLIAGAITTWGLVFGSGQSTPQPTTALLADSFTPTHTPTITATPVPTLSQPTATPSLSPSSTPSPPPSPTTAAGVAASARVRGPVSLILRFYDSEQAPQGTAYEAGGSSSAVSVIYLEDKYPYGEVVTQIGSAVFRIDRSAPDYTNAEQRLPPYLQLSIEYSQALRAAVQEGYEPGFKSDTGEFWLGRLRCGSAIPATSSPFRITVRLLEDGREIAKRQVVIGVLNNPTCAEGDQGGGGSPPDHR